MLVFHNSPGQISENFLNHYKFDQSSFMSLQVAGEKNQEIVNHSDQGTQRRRCQASLENTKN